MLSLVLPGITLVHVVGRLLVGPWLVSLVTSVPCVIKAGMSHLLQSKV